MKLAEKNDFNQRLAEALSKGQTFAFFASCEINYSGRAEAYLPQGDRLVIIKADRSLLIHQPTGGPPINYLKPGAEITLEKEEKHILLKARSGTDYLDVPLYRVYDAMSRKLEDGQKQTLAGNEKDMSDMIKDNPHLIAPDFKPLSREEHTTFGFIDVFGHDGAGNLVVVECKRYTAGLSCVTQLRRYVEKIKALKGVQNVKGVMAAPGITANALSMLTQWGFTHVHIDPPKRLERHNKHQQGLGGYL